MDSLRGIISDLHVFLYGGIRTLPITLAGTMVILGLFTANYAMMFFLAGMIIVVPIISVILNKLADLLMVTTGVELFKVKTSDVCDFVIPYSTIKNPSKLEFVNIFCTTSFAMICFFIGYIMTNAVELYKKKPEQGVDPAKVTKRTSRAVLAMASIAVFTIIVLGYRVASGCEPLIGYILGAPIFALIGYGYYSAISSPMDGRLADLFGITNRILPSSATTDKPIACIIDPNVS